MSYSNPMSFLPEDFVKARSQKKKRIIMIGVIIAGIGLLGGGAFVGRKYVKFDVHTVAAAQTPTPTAQPVYAPAPAPAPYVVESHLIEQAHKLSEEPRKLMPAVELTTTDLDKVPLSQLLSEVNNALPSGVSLLDLTLESKRVSAAATTETDAAPTVAYTVTIQILGTAESDVEVAKFINRLGKSPVLKNLNLLLSDQTAATDGKGRQFHLEMGLDPADNSKPSTSTAEVDPSPR